MGFLKDHQHTKITDLVVKSVSSDKASITTVLPQLVSLIEEGEDYDNNNNNNNNIKLTKYEMINNQLECGRQIRKFFKYGKYKEKIKALQLFNLIVSQELRYTEMFNETKFLKQLETMAMGITNVNGSANTNTIYGGTASGSLYAMDSADFKNIQKVSKITKNYIISWCSGNRNPQMYNGCYAGFFKILKKIKTSGNNGGIHRRNISRNFMSDTADASLHPDDIKYGIPVILDIDVEKPKIKNLISDSLNCSVTLKNSLSLLKRGESSVDSEECTKWFIKSRNIRRKVLRYLQLIPDGEFLGALISANDELVDALQKYDDLSGNVDDYDGDDSLSDYSGNVNEQISEEEYDEDSEEEEEEEEDEEEEDEDNPFGDSNHL